MNSSNQAGGQQPADICAVTEAISESNQDEMKRQAAAQLIQNYYRQLTDGCGNPDCDNSACASSSGFTFKSADRNKLALQAIALSRTRARLCDAIPQKCAKFPVEETHGSSPTDEGASTSGEHSGGATSAVSPGGSRVGNGGGAKATVTASSSSSSLSSKTDKETRTSGGHSGKASSVDSPGRSKVGDGGGAKAKVIHNMPSASSSSSSLSSKTVEETSYLDEETVNQLIKEGQTSGSWNRLIRTIGSVFSNPDSLMQSFCISSGHSRMEPDPDKDIDDTEAMSVDPFPVQEIGDRSCAPSTSVQDLSRGDNSEIPEEGSVDIESLRRSYAQLLSIPDLPFQGALITALTSLSRTLQMDFKYHHVLDRQPGVVNIFVVVMEYPHLHSPEFLDAAFPAFCKALGLLPVSAQARLVRVWAGLGAGRLTELLQMLQQLITVRVITHESSWSRSFSLNDDQAVTGAVSVMKVVYYASLYGGHRDSPELLEEERKSNEGDRKSMSAEGAMGVEPKEQFEPREDPLAAELRVSPLNVRKPMIAAEEFINEPLNEHIDISVDYSYFKAEQEGKFSFMLHSFVLNTASKQVQMYFDNRVRMLQERRTSLLQTIMHGGSPMPYLRLRVRRDHVVSDALVNLEVVAVDSPADLKKQLFVEFEGEQGLDEGGVSKEFFQLIIEELFNPDIGMFTLNQETRDFWFNPLSFETESQFTLIGIVMGLAIYNSCILNVQFPMVVYRKLMGKKGVFEDLFTVDPTLARSLQDMLDYAEDDFEDVFMQTFRIGFKDIFGNDIDYVLKEGAADALVTQANKQEFVDLYADYILNKSIDVQFRAFKKGFLMVTNESPIQHLFRPDELESLVSGSKEYDFCALEQSTEYDGGFTSDSETIKNFWEVVHDFSDEDKKRLLQFTTGSDRVPVGGLSKLKFIIARNGSDSDKLPTSHTCFNVLLLPDYSTKAKLEERLLKAVKYSQGFGML